MSGPFNRLREGLPNILVTLVVMVPVAIAVGDHGWLFSAVAFMGVCGAVMALVLLLPHGSLFVLGIVTGLAIYICLYVVLGRSAFPAAAWWSDAVCFLMPIIAFVGACAVRRGSLALPADAATGDAAELAHLPRFARWLSLCTLVAVLCLALPLNRLSPGNQTLALFFAMLIISVLTVISVREVVLLLVDVAVILGAVAARMRFLAVPMVTYTLLFSLLTVGFACFYRLADGLSSRPLFRKHGEIARLDFSESLHFSVVTLATVGYGDILPLDDGIRLLATIEMVVGQLLLLFGFAEIMRGKLGSSSR